MVESEIETILGISGSVTNRSKTKRAIETSLDAAASAFDVETDLVHLGDWEIETADGRLLADYDGETATVLEKIVEADAYLVGTPVYRASYSGALKNLFDMVPRGKWQADVAPFENAAVGLVATGATPHHFLAIDTELRPLLAFFGAQPVGSSVYAHGEHFDDENEIVDPAVRERLEALGKATVELGDAIATSESVGTLGPQI